MSRGLVLLIEDDRYQQRLYTRALESAGYTVVASGAGEMAPRLCDLHGPKLVILDINLPGINGIETCKRIRQQYSNNVPVIFVTSGDKLEAMEEGMEAGGDDFIVKGGAIQGYLERIGYWIRRRGLSPDERKAILQKVRSRRPTPPPPAEAASKLTAEFSAARPSDASAVAQMAAFVAEARARTPVQFGTQPTEKLVLLGYAAGVVNALANANLEVKGNIAPHLKALLTETRLLSPTEIETSLGQWHTMYRIPAFGDACKKGEEEYGRRLDGDADSPPSPLQTLVPAGS
ncbi:MAG: response regulator [Alphaproteobacteria bacterium]|nr:response regulator [Alphaproteobacteria bacterium]